jgi:hypothetical protein
MKFTHDQNGTHYVLWRFDYVGGNDSSHAFCVETGWGSGYGQWIMLHDCEIHWSYLTEKMPGLKEGDKPGLIALFKKAGLEVFG